MNKNNLFKIHKEPLAGEVFMETKLWKEGGSELKH